MIHFNHSLHYKEIDIFIFCGSGKVFSLFPVIRPSEA